MVRILDRRQKHRENAVDVVGGVLEKWCQALIHDVDGQATGILAVSSGAHTVGHGEKTRRAPILSSPGPRTPGILIDVMLVSNVCPQGDHMGGDPRLLVFGLR